MSPAARPSPADPPSAFEREIARLAAQPEVRSALAWLRDQESDLARWQLDLARIPAPPFGEEARSDWLAEKFNAIGLDQVQKDAIGNVFGVRSVGTPSAKDTFVS